MTSWHGNTFRITGPLWWEKTLVICNAACAELWCFPRLLARMNFRTNSGAGVIWNSMKLMGCHCYVYRLYWFLLVVYIDILVLNYVISHNSALETPQLNTLRPRQDGHHFLDDILKYIFLNENIKILIKISLKFVSKGSINNIPALVQIMARHQPGEKPLSEPIMVSLLTYICVTWPQWVNAISVHCLFMSC